MKTIAACMFGFLIVPPAFGQQTPQQQQWNLQRAQERQQLQQQQQVRQQSNQDAAQQRQMENDRAAAELQMRRFVESEQRRSQAVPAPIGQGCNPRVQTC